MTLRDESRCRCLVSHAVKGGSSAALRAFSRLISVIKGSELRPVIKSNQPEAIDYTSLYRTSLIPATKACPTYHGDIYALPAYRLPEVTRRLRIHALPRRGMIDVLPHILGPI